MSILFTYNLNNDSKEDKDTCCSEDKNQGEPGLASIFSKLFSVKNLTHLVK
jgi:hypothetical protein